MSNTDLADSSLASSDDDVFTEWMDGWELWPAQYYLSIPYNCYGRPVWEPPILVYSPYIGEEYEKKRKAMLEYTGGDVARATDIMDADTEVELLYEYQCWVDKNLSGKEGDPFFTGLLDEVAIDFVDVRKDWRAFDGGIYYKKNADGTYKVKRNAFVFSESENSDLPSENASHLPATQAHPNGSDTNSNFNSSNRALPAQALNPPSSPKDEDDARSWITFSDLDSDVDADDLRHSNIATDQHFKHTPLALRLVSLRSTFVASKMEMGQNTADEDELD